MSPNFEKLKVCYQKHFPRLKIFDWSTEEHVFLFTKIRYISRDFAKCLGEDIP